MAPILVSVSPYVPERSSPYAGHQWYFHFLEALGGHYDVVTLAPATAENRAVVGKAPSETRLLAGVGHWRRSEQQRGPVDKLGDELLRGVLRLDETAGELLARSAVVDVQWPRALPHAPEVRRRAPEAVVTYVAHDLHYANWRWDRLQALPGGKRLAGLLVGRAVRRRELRLIAGCDAFFAFKQADVDDVHRAGVAIPGLQVAPWLDRPNVGTPPPSQRRDVLFVAAFDRPQNRWGADWLLERVWPAVTAQVAEARLVLAGGGAPADLKDAARRVPDVVVTGFVEDLRALYEGAACVVAPVFGGAGLRFKVPQAMLYGRALVVTPLALEGLEEAPPDCFGGVTDDPTEFARCVVEALRGSERTRRAERLAPAWVDAHLSFDRSVEAVVETYHRLRRR